MRQSKNKIKKATIVKGVNGGYDIIYNDEKHNFMLLGNGATVAEAKKDFLACRDEMADLYQAQGKDFPSIAFFYLHKNQSK